MKITLWGVRGSFPSPGRHTLRYGGSTSCVSVETPEAVLVLDAGTGIIGLGDHLVQAADTRPLYVLLTHAHLDHVFGLPFFAPLYEEGREVVFFNLMLGEAEWTPLGLFDGRYVPTRPATLRARLRVVTPGDTASVLGEAGLAVTSQPVNHPGGAYAYRVEHGGHALVYAPDSEIDPPEPLVSPFELAAFCAGTDVLIHDAQYTDADLPQKRGWGHSRVSEACALAEAAGAGQLVLFHHDPARTDDALDALQAEARAALRPSGIRCDAACEGWEVEL
jgi:phosphoribosyl 1,2-cyclic phosphodiesterase